MRAYHTPGKHRIIAKNLIHSMLHAYFLLYICRCKNGCGDKLLESHSHYGSHDIPWLTAAYGIEQVDTVIVKGKDQKTIDMGVLLGLDLSRNRHVACSWDCIPPEIELRRLGLDIVEIRKELSERRQFMADRLKWQRRRRQLIELNRCTRGMWTVDIENWNYGSWNSVVALTRA